MKVYGVEYVEYDDSDVVEMFTTKESAEQCAKWHNENSEFTYYVRYWDVDETFTAPEKEEETR